MDIKSLLITLPTHNPQIFPFPQLQLYHHESRQQEQAAISQTITNLTGLLLHILHPNLGLLNHMDR